MALMKTTELRDNEIYFLMIDIAWDRYEMLKVLKSLTKLSYITRTFLLVAKIDILFLNLSHHIQKIIVNREH